MHDRIQMSHHSAAWCPILFAGLLAAAVLGSAAATTDDASLARNIQAALADAANRTGIAAAALKVASAERVTWLDGSLGCPEPDAFYTQALVPGYRIRIAAGDEVLDYHADMRGAPLLCPPARAVEPASSHSERGRGQPEHVAGNQGTKTL